MITQVPRERLAQFKEYDGHESVYFFHNEVHGLRGFIALHKTRGGHATGGTRYYSYTHEDDALRDVLNLSRAMTYKCALADVPYGGGKAVIIADRMRPKTIDALRAYGAYINALEGKFSTGEDVGITEDDVVAMAQSSSHINGLPEIAGDPSPWAARSVFVAMEAALEYLTGTSNFQGKRIAIKGLGKVGSELARMLARRGAHLIVADINEDQIAALSQELPSLEIADPVMVHMLPVDVYAPCALGGEFTSDGPVQLRSRIVCGAANNQLVDREAGEMLHRAGVVYIPDYVANAGGLINVVDALMPSGYQRSRVEQKISGVRSTVFSILQRARAEGRATYDVADAMARSRFA